MARIGVVVNANARKVRKRPSLARELRDVLGVEGAVVETRALEELRPAVERLLAEGATVLVAAGGDGALHRLANVLLDLRDEGALDVLPPLVPTNGGTIDFVAKKVGLRGDAIEILGRLRAQGTPNVVSIPSLELRGVESGGIESGGDVGRPFRRVGFALAAGGVGQRFFEQYYALEDPGPPSIVRIVGRAVTSQVLGSLGRMPRVVTEPSARMFAFTEARVSIDGVPVEGTRHNALHAGAFFLDLGGVFRFFPLASDGQLHFHAGAVGPWGIIGSVPRMALGRRLRAQGLVETAGREMIVEATGAPLSPVVDGETYEGVLRLEVRPGPTIDIAVPRP